MFFRIALRHVISGRHILIETIEYCGTSLRAAGKHAVLEASHLLDGFSWGVAGRSEEKLAAVLKEMGKKADKDLSQTPIIICDVNDEASLQKMAEGAKVSECGHLIL